MFPKLWKAAAGGAISIVLGAFMAMPSLAQDVQGVSADKVVKLGTWAPRSGPLAGLGSSAIDGSYLAFDEVNANGGVNGYKIEVVEVDDGYEPARTVAAVRKLWEQDKVFMIFEPYGSTPTKAASRYVLDNNIPLLFTVGGADVFHNDPANPPSNVYSYYPFFEQLVHKGTSYAVDKLGDKKIGIVYIHGDFGEAGHRAWKAGAERYGYTLGTEIGYAWNETNFVSLGRKIAASGDDMTVLWSAVGGPQIMAAAEQAGYKGDWLISTVQIGRSAEAEYRKVPSLADRVYLPHFLKMPNDDSADMRAFVEKVGAKFPDADINIALMGYTNAKVFIEALERATKGGEPLTWPSFQKALLSIDGFDVGASVKLSYAKSPIGNANGRVYKWDGDNWKAESDFAPLPER